MFCSRLMIRSGLRASTQPASTTHLRLSTSWTRFVICSCLVIRLRNFPCPCRKLTLRSLIRTLNQRTSSSQTKIIVSFFQDLVFTDASHRIFAPVNVSTCRAMEISQAPPVSSRQGQSGVGTRSGTVSSSLCPSSLSRYGRCLRLSVPHASLAHRGRRHGECQEDL